jgi:hypothetical protein
MYGLGILGVGAVGVTIYEVTKGASNTGAAVLPVIPGQAPPIVNPARPVIAASGTFSNGAQPPAGPMVTMAPGTVGQQTVPQNQSLVIVLPTGASWTKVRYGNTAASVTAAQVNLGSDLTTAVALTGAQLMGSNSLVATWVDASGKAQVTVVPFTIQKVVTLRA